MQGNGTVTASKAGNYNLSIVDSNGATESVSFYVKEELQSIPNAKVKVNHQFSLVAIGGVSPIQYRVVGGVGSISTDGRYLSSVPGVSTIEATDAISNKIIIPITVESDIHVTYDEIMGEVESQTIIPSGGKSPYSFYIVEGDGFLQTSGIYTSSSLVTTKIKVVDSLGYEIDFLVDKLPMPLLALKSSDRKQICTRDCMIDLVGGYPPYQFELLTRRSNDDPFVPASPSCLTIDSSGALKTGPDWKQCSTQTLFVTDSRGDQLKMLIEYSTYYGYILIIAYARE